jgi:hypothetical protein
VTFSTFFDDGSEMMSDFLSKCPKCGAEVDSGNTDPNSSEPCPGCLLQLAAQSDSMFDSCAQSEHDALASVKVGRSGPDRRDAPDVNKPSHKSPDLATVQRAFPQLEILEQIGRGGMVRFSKHGSRISTVLLR